MLAVAKIVSRIQTVKNSSVNVILFILSFAAYIVKIGHNGYGYLYISAPVRSMYLKTSNLWDIAYDAGGVAGGDKPPVGLWLQYVGTRLLGYNAIGLHIASAVCGATCVILLKTIVSRTHGKAAGVLSGVILLLTPGFLAVSRSNAVDVVCIMFCLFALNMYMQSIDSTFKKAYTQTVLAGLFIGLAFLTKMWAAAFILPSMFIVIVLMFGINLDAFKRGTLLLASTMLLPFLWVSQHLLRTSAPKSTNSPDGTLLGLIWGHNGPGRIVGFNAVNEIVGPEAMGPNGSAGSVGKFLQFGGERGILRLFDTSYGDQNMWYALIALTGVVALLVDNRVQRHLITLLLGWSVTVYLVLSYASYGAHVYYSSAIAPGLAGLAGIGIHHMFSKTKKVYLTIGILLTAITNYIFVTRVDPFVLITLATVAACLIAVIVLISKMPTRYLSASIILLAVAPAFWTYSGVVNPQRNSFPNSRPLNAQMREVVAEQDSLYLSVKGKGFPGGDYSREAGEWLKSNHTNETWMGAVYSATQGNEWIVNGYTLLPIGGVFGGDKIVSLDEIGQYILERKLRYFIVPDDSKHMKPGVVATDIMLQVKKLCTKVDENYLVNEHIYDCLDVSIR